MTGRSRQPVLGHDREIGNKERLDDQNYRGRASRLVEILLDIDNYRGVGRVYIP